MEIETEAVKQDFVIDIPMYQCKVFVYLCVDIIEACRELKLNEQAINTFESIELSGLTIADSKDSGNYIILFHEDIKLDTIVHETDHAVGFILLARNTPYTHETMETYAYFKEYLFKTIKDKLKAFIKN